MANFDLLVVGAGGKEQRKPSSGLTIDYTAVRIGASNLTISESSGKFDMEGKIVGNIAAAVASGQAVEYAQLNTALALYIPLAQKGANSGVATLDAGGKIPVAQLPSTIMTYEGTFDASGTPASPLLNGAGAADAGMVYLASVAGSFNFGAGAISFNIGDWAVYNGSIWQKSTNSNAVVSVNSQTGVVVLSTTDIAEGTNLYFTAARFNSSFDTRLALKSTSDLAEGSNLYYTAARFNTAFSGKSTSDLAEGSNLYFTAARAKSAAVADAIVDSVTDVAPSQNAVFDALALKADKSAAFKSMVNDSAGSITIRQVVYVKSNGAVDLALATNGALADGVIGLVADASIATTASGSILFAKGDQVSGFSGLTPGKKYYVSRTSAGSIALYSAISWVAGDAVVRIGVALSASVLEFDAEFEFEY